MAHLSRIPARFILAAVLATTVAFPVYAMGIPLHHKSNSDQQIIEKIEEQIRQALLAGNPAVLDHVLADDYLGISSNGTLSDKQEYIREIGHHESAFTQLTISDTKVRFQNSTAIVTCSAAVTGQLDGKSVHGNFRYTRVYGKQPNGTWKVLSFEATQVSGNGSGEFHRGVPVASGSLFPDTH